MKGNYSKLLELLMVFTAAVVPVSLVSCGGDDKDDVLNPNNTVDNGNDNGNKPGTVKVAEAVDLGLSVKWASFNVGATSQTEMGDRFAWGETSPKEYYTANTYTFADGKNESRSLTLSNSNDAASANWGNGWRMPTLEEMVELRDKCDRQAHTINGVRGVSFIGPNGNSIFLPAETTSGSSRAMAIYWSRTKTPYNVYGTIPSGGIRYLRLNPLVNSDQSERSEAGSSMVYIEGMRTGEYGYYVRPVRK